MHMSQIQCYLDRVGERNVMWTGLDLFANTRGLLSSTFCFLLYFLLYFPLPSSVFPDLSTEHISNELVRPKIITIYTVIMKKESQNNFGSLET